MSCSCCCTNTLNFCDQDVCGSIDFDIKAQITGIHKLVTYFLNSKITIEASFGVDDEIIFPLDLLNEDYEYTAEVYDPTGARVLIRKDSIDYDCFKFKTVVNINLVQVAEESGI